jgi:sec-independent protein translocase protein TatA
LEALSFNGSLTISRGESMRTLGGPEIVVIAVVFLLLFGGAKLPGLAKGLGEGIRNFKSSMKGEDETPPKQKTK